MTTPTLQTLLDDQLEQRLRRLATVSLPPGLEGRIRAQIGLAGSYFTLATPIGTVFIALSTRGIIAVDTAPDAATFEERYRTTSGRVMHPLAKPPAALLSKLERHLAGHHQDIPFDLDSLTPFQRAVLRTTAEIPFGEVRPYVWVATHTGHPRAARAAGSALAQNPIPLFIPCHRVVRSDGIIGEYALGTAAKRHLLQAEGVDLTHLTALGRHGIRFVGSDTTQIVCYPTCRDARQIQPSHLQSFHSLTEAAAAGYHPCRRCQPVAAVA
ncbi:MAG: methylated-DNA--[protein]-cysteine S-methyltransferase [Chloroflexi bacterium]|nr:methylated-DNA--[protein]-cysteine S-methyltransferase [Chloroflexota bacterium]